MNASIHKQALRYVNRYYPHACVAILGGSAANGGITKGSDLDVVIFEENAESSYRSVDKRYGYIFEVFFVAMEQFPLFLEEAQRSGIPSFVRLCAEGVILVDRGQAAGIIARAKEVWQEGPYPKTFGELDRLRYEITELLEDLRHSRSSGEDLFVAARLLETIVQFVLGANDQWLGVGKWCFRALKEFDADMANELERTAEFFYRTGVKEELLVFADRQLAPYGGRQREGWREGTSFAK